MYVSNLKIQGIRSFVGERSVDLDFTRPDGSYAGWTVLAGRNGSGKTTVLQAIALGLAASGTGLGAMILPLVNNAFIASFGICFALYLFGKLTQFVPEALQPVIAFLSIDGHFENIGRGVIDTRDVIYYLSVIGVCLLVATTALESRKWK